MKYILLLLLAMSTHLYALSQNQWFADRDFGNYFIADHFSPMIKVNTGLGLNLNDYNINSERASKYVMYNETIIGDEIPIYNYQSENSKHQLSISTPISFSVWFDFTEDITAPILNTDYRFAPVELNYIWHSNNTHIKNIAVKFVPFFHESTHIGDELTIVRMMDSLQVTRVNISYETFQLAVTINDANKKIEKNHSFKLGAQFLLNGRRGWYSISEYEGDTTLFNYSPIYEDENRVISNRWAEPYLQYQYQNPESFLSGDQSMFTISIDQSLRVKHNYPIESPLLESSKRGTALNLDQEAYAYCLATMWGWQLINSNHELSGLGVFLRTYIGLNYHGQFRNIPIYHFFGASIVYGG